MIDKHTFHIPVELPLKKLAREGDPAFIGWGFATNYGLNNYLWEPYTKRMNDVGFDTDIVNYNDNMPGYTNTLFRYNHTREARAGGIGTSTLALQKGDPEHPQRGLCLNDPEFLASAEASVRGGARAVGVISMQGGDENNYAGTGQDICFSNHCMTRMQKWLRRRYAGLEALNRQWGTAFKTWDAVRPLTRKETSVRGDRNYSSWCDHRLFGTYTFSNYFGRLATAAGEERAGLRYGISGNEAPGAYSGTDFWMFSKRFNHIEAYEGTDELSCFAGDDFSMTAWMGFADEAATRYRMYSHLLNGGTGFALCGTYHTINLDWTWSISGRGYNAVMPDIKRGIGRLLVESRLHRDPIAVHYSQSSANIAEALGQPALWRHSRLGFTKLAASSGFQPRWVSYEQLAGGQLGGARILVLPMSGSISDEEARTIRRFVTGGGVLVGQLSVGIADGYGKIREPGVLDDLFGIKRNRSRIAASKSKLRRRLSSTGLVAPEMAVNFVEKGIAAAAAEILAEDRESAEPLVFARKHGQGLAIYLACDLFPAFVDLNRVRGIGSNHDAASQAESFLRQAGAKSGVTPQIEVTFEDGKRVPFIKPAFFRSIDGRVRYFVLLRNPHLAGTYDKDPVKVTVKFSDIGYVYEIMAGEDYGRTQMISTTFTPETLKIYSLLPYEVRAMTLSLKNKTVAPGDVVSYEIAIEADGNAGTHTLRMDVIDPAGNESGPYSRNITAANGK
ncbi:MAG: beta-galactosidase trimerization domain-containing protein, partial [Lentisphaeria bacterium]|nr:beta-galactosidase trimerization domain-containing protein [Lentisphaeria bacterium]